MLTKHVPFHLSWYLRDGTLTRGSAFDANRRFRAALRACQVFVVVAPESRARPATRWKPARVW